jgi:hypothetical protein
MNLKPPFAFVALALCCLPSYAQRTGYSIVCNVVGVPSSSQRSAALRIKVDHQRVLTFKSETVSGPHRIVILRDLSGSVRQGTAQKLESEIIRDFAESVAEGDRVAIVDFAREVSLDIPLTDPKSFKEAFSASESHPLPIHGTTSLYDAIDLALDHLKSHGGFLEGDSIILISDGADNASRIHKRKLEDKVMKSGVRVYLVAFIYRMGPSPEELGAEQIYDVVQDSGGMTLGIKANNDHTQIPYYQNSDPKYDISAQSLEATKQTIISLHDFIDRYTRFSFDLAAPVTKPTKFSIEAVGERAAAKTVCPRFVVPRLAQQP